MNKIPYKIFEIITNYFTIVSSDVTKESPINIKTSFEYAVSLADHKIRCKGDYEYIQKDTQLLKTSVTCSFDVESNAFNAMKKDGVLTIPTAFLQYMATINVGTTRGIIHSQTIGSPLNKIVLPPINLTKIITTPAEFKCEK